MMDVKYDAILVLGGGVKKDGALPEWIIRRLNKAIEMYSGKEKIITLSAGTTHKPPVIKKNGFPLSEAEAAANFLIKKGISRENIWMEKMSLDTIGNAYFARMIHAEPAKLKKLAIITSKFHMPRTKAIFNWIFSLAPLQIEYDLDFIEADDKGIGTDLINIKKDREAVSLAKLDETKKGIRDLSQFHDWLYTKHSAYATDIKSPKLFGKILENY